MRRPFWMMSSFLCSLVLISTACSKAKEAPPAEGVVQTRAPLEAATADRAAKEEPAIEGSLEADAGAAEGEVASEAAAEGATAAEGEPPAKIELFRQALADAGFTVIDVEPLLPDVLGGLRDTCEALERNRVNLENEDWTNLGIFESPQQAKACLEAYLETPGADRIRNSYVQTGPYVLEIRPSMPGPAQSQIKDLFARVVAQ